MSATPITAPSAPMSGPRVSALTATIGAAHLVLWAGMVVASLNHDEDPLAGLALVLGPVLALAVGVPVLVAAACARDAARSGRHRRARGWLWAAAGFVAVEGLYLLSAAPSWIAVVAAAAAVAPLWVMTATRR